MQRALAVLALVAALLLLGVKIGAVILAPASLSARISPYVWQVGLLAALFATHFQLSGDTKAGLGRLFLSLTVVGLGLFTAAFIGMIALVDRGLEGRSYRDVIDHPQKIWSTRGLVSGGPELDETGNQNTVEGVSLAFERGAQGVEVDVYWDQATNRFAVSHDRPYKTVNGKVLPLGDMLAQVEEPRAWWLDWKKLRHLDSNELASATTRLREITTPRNLRERFYVEGEDPFNLDGVQKAGFKTIFDTHPLPDSNPVAPLLIDAYKALYYYAGHTVMSMESGSADEPIIGESAKKLLRHVPLFLYHTPDEPERIRRLLAMENVRVILLRDHSLDRYQLTADAPK